MLFKSAVTKIGNVDFFAVFPAGFYTFLIIFFSGISEIVPYNASQSLMIQLKPLIIYIQDNPISIFFLFFVSYLLGSIISAMPVNWAKTFPLKEEFPFTERLKKVIENLVNDTDATQIDKDKLPKINKKVSRDVFNYWKDVISMETPEAFAYYQTFETRSRYFAGMFWAGIIGIIGILWIFVRTGTIVYQFVLEQFILSIVLILAFGGQLIRVRRIESCVLLGLYISYIQNRRK